MESLPVALAAFGEGWHNYHHVFPWDYKTSEFGDYKFNVSTAFIDFFAKIGWARDREYSIPTYYENTYNKINIQFKILILLGKYVSPEMVARRVAKSGDGTHPNHSECVWGFGDVDICKADLKELHQMKS